MALRRGRLIGVGVDLIETERAERFVRSHPDGVARFLTPQENLLLRRARRRGLAFAFLFAAKEAASKAVGQSLSGPGMFRDFQVSKRGGRLQVRWVRPRGGAVRIDLYPFVWQRLAGVLAYGYGTRPSRLVK